MSSCLFVYLYWAIDVELNIYLTIRLVTEIVCHTSYPHTLVEALFVEKAVVITHWVGHREICIAESDKYHWLSVGLLWVKINRVGN